jgi:hypothetical protein
MAGKNGVGAVELLEGDDESEFVLEREGAEGPEEVGGVEQRGIVSVGTADDHGDASPGLSPLVDFGGEFAAGRGRAAFVEHDA